MGVDWLSGGLVVALAAVLWLLYLLPSWFRRNEYLATEKNAVRLQQTLRILAETSEVPDVVRAEANARSVVEQQRRLKKVIMDSTPTAVVEAAKIRRSRAVASVILLLAVVATVLGTMQIALTGAWVVMVIGALVAVVCVLRLAKLAKMGRLLRLPLESAAQMRQPVAPEFADHGADFEPVVQEEEAEAAEWTPVEIPRPLYLSRRAPSGVSVTAAPVVPAEDGDEQEQRDDAAARLRAASLRAQEALRQAAVAQADSPATVSRPAASAVESAGSMPEAIMPPQPEIPQERPAPVRQQQPSRFASMGIVEEAETAVINLDEVMARRRAV